MFDLFVFPCSYVDDHTDFIIHTDVNDLHIDLLHNAVYVPSPATRNIYYRRDNAPDRIQHYLKHAKRIECETPTGARFTAAHIAGRHALAYALVCMYATAHANVHLLPELRALVGKYVIRYTLGNYDRT